MKSMFRLFFVLILSLMSFILKQPDVYAQNDMVKRYDIIADYVKEGFIVEGDEEYYWFLSTYKRGYIFVLDSDFEIVKEIQLARAVDLDFVPLQLVEHKKEEGKIVFAAATNNKCCSFLELNTYTKEVSFLNEVIDFSNSKIYVGSRSLSFNDKGNAYIMFGDKEQNVFVQKLKPDFSLDWQKEYPLKGVVYDLSIKYHKDFIYFYGANKHSYIAKTDTNGNVIYEKTLWATEYYSSRILDLIFKKDSAYIYGTYDNEKSYIGVLNDYGFPLALYDIETTDNKDFRKSDIQFVDEDHYLLIYPGESKALIAYYHFPNELLWQREIYRSWNNFLPLYTQITTDGSLLLSFSRYHQWEEDKQSLLLIKTDCLTHEHNCNNLDIIYEDDQPVFYYFKNSYNMGIRGGFFFFDLLPKQIPAQCTLYNINGQIIGKGIFKDDTVFMGYEADNDQLYIYQIQTADGQIYSGKIMFRKDY